MKLRLGKRTLFAAGLGLACSIVATYFLCTVSADSLPQVRLNADSITPRSIEDLTGKNVARDYAYAWRDLAEALDMNRANTLNGYFTGFAKEGFNNRISDQRRAGIHTHYLDRGHRVEAVFYAPDGGEMQLIDQAKLEVQILDGERVIYKEDGTQYFLVLMTPGADRWFVRALQPVPEAELHDLKASK